MRNNNTPLGDKNWVVILGIISAILAIFTFITGMDSIKAIFALPKNPATPTSMEYIEVFPTPTETLTPQPVSTSTFTPTSTVVYEDVQVDYPGMNVKITDYTPPEGSKYSIRVLIRATAGDVNNNVIVDNSWKVSPVIKDFTGSWVEGTTGGVNLYNGSRKNDDGTFELFLSEDYGQIGLVSIKSEGVSCWEHGDIKFPIIPVYKYKTTEVEVHFALLEFGVLDKVSKQPIHGTLYLAPADADSTLAWKCGVRGFDDRGLATFILTEGRYIATFSYGKEYEFPEFSITSGEYLRIVINEQHVGIAQESHIRENAAGEGVRAKAGRVLRRIG